MFASLPFVWLQNQKYIFTLCENNAFAMFCIQYGDWYCILIQNPSKQISNKCNVVCVMFVCHHQQLNRLTCVLFNFFCVCDQLSAFFGLCDQRYNLNCCISLENRMDE